MLINTSRIFCSDASFASASLLKNDASDSLLRLRSRPGPPPGSPGTRYPALRALGALLTALAYLLALLALAIGVLLYFRTGAEKNLLYIFGGVIAAAVSFIVFKVFAESAKLGADLGDMESRMIQLLFELRDKLDNLK